MADTKEPETAGHAPPALEPLPVPPAPDLKAAQHKVAELTARLAELQATHAAVKDSNKDQVEAILSGREAEAAALIEQSSAEAIKKEQLIRSYGAALEVARSELETTSTMAREQQRQAATALIQKELESFLNQLSACHATYKRIADFVAACTQEEIAVEKLPAYVIDAEGQRLASSVQETVGKNSLDPGLIEKLDLPRPWTVSEPICVPESTGQPAPGVVISPVPPDAAKQQTETVFRLEAYMPAEVAALKLAGFASEYGGTIVENSPGLIRVRLPMLRRIMKPTGKSGIISWLGLKPKFGKVDLELRMSQRDGAKKGFLDLEVLLRPKGKVAAPNHSEWQDSCEALMVDLKSFLMTHPL